MDFSLTPREGDRLPLYGAEPGPKDQALTHLANCRKISLNAPAGGCDPGRVILGLFTVNHTGLEPDVACGQVCAVTEPKPWDTCFLVRLDGRLWACRLRSCKGGGHVVYFWRSGVAPAYFVPPSHTDFEVLGALLTPNNSFSRTHPFWPITSMSSN